MTSTWHLLTDSLSHFWEQRQQREKQYLLTSGVFLIAMLIYVIAIDPALTGRDELQKSLPRLHQDAAEMQAMAQQLASLPVLDSQRTEISKENIDDALARNGLKPGGKGVTSTLSVTDGVVRLQLFGVSMVEVQTWLIEMQKTTSLYAEEAKITRVDGGLVNVVLMLRQPDQNN